MASLEALPKRPALVPCQAGDLMHAKGLNTITGRLICAVHGFRGQQVPPDSHVSAKYCVSVECDLSKVVLAVLADHSV